MDYEKEVMLRGTMRMRWSDHYKDLHYQISTDDSHDDNGNDIENGFVGGSGSSSGGDDHDGYKL